MWHRRERQRNLESCGCNCGGRGMFHRRFKSATEMQKELEEYRDQLHKELSGVEERIQEFKGK